ncbi:hypothetical protein LJR084_001872 [Variovorax sp. LjRoot84]|uniref:hypothetical protein n=1 Tax=Variovorax sp. LjRoot84 TaxID=3342340 RepID=UPI003ECED90D
MSALAHPDLFEREAFIPANGLVRTPRTPRGGGILIGSRWQPGPRPLPADATLIQSALLEPRTSRPLPVLQRIAGAVWRWC